MNNSKALIVFIFLLFVSCNDDMPEQIVVLTPEFTEIMPSQVVVLSTESNINEERYTGQMGGENFDILRTDAGDLAFLVPDIEPGNHVLTFNMDGKSANINFKVIANEINSAATVIEEQFKTPVNDLKSVASQLLESNISPDKKSQLIIAQEQLDDFLSHLENATPEEKLQFARFVNANSLIFQSLINYANAHGRIAETDWSCIEDNGWSFVGGVIIVVGAVPVFASIAGTGAGLPVALAGTIAYYYFTFSVVGGKAEKLTQECFKPADAMLAEVNSGGRIEQNTFTFINGEGKTLEVQAEVRNLIASDSIDNNELIRSVVTSYVELQQHWNVLKNGINNIIIEASDSILSWFSEFSKYELITTEYSDLPETADIHTIPVSNSAVIFSGFPDDVEVNFQRQGENNVTLLFKAENSTLPRSINGTMIYDDGMFSFESPVTIELKKAKVLNLSIFSGNGQEDYRTYTLANPFVVQVKDDKQQPVSGVSIEWRVIEGNGNLFNEDLITDDEGKASANYTLSSFVSLDRIEVKAIYNDAEIEGSPVIFEALVHAFPGE